MTNESKTGEVGVLVVTPEGSNFWRGENTRVVIDKEGLLTVKRDVEVVITREAVDSAQDLSPRERQSYINRIGEKTTNEIAKAFYPSGSWLKVELMHSVEDDPMGGSE